MRSEGNQERDASGLQRMKELGRLDLREASSFQMGILWGKMNGLTSSVHSSFFFSKRLVVKVVLSSGTNTFDSWIASSLFLFFSISDLPDDEEEEEEEEEDDEGEGETCAILKGLGKETGSEEG